MKSIHNFFKIKESPFPSLFDNCENIWEIIPIISVFLKKNLKAEFLGKTIGDVFIGENVYVGKGSVIEHGAMIKGPAWIGENVQVRAGAYIRENAIIGDGCVIGNSTEIKNSMLFPEVQAPHYNYIGDSICGRKAHLGAGVILSNFKLDGGEIRVRLGEEIIHTGLRKFGAVIGDEVEIGCKAVLNPGSLIGRDAKIYPGVIWQGYLPPSQVAKNSS